MKKKRIYVIVIILAVVVLGLIVLASYIEKKNSVVNDFKGVSMYIKDASLSASGLTLSINNDSSKAISLNDQYDIERQVGNKWYKVPYQSLSGSKLQSTTTDVSAKSDGEAFIKIDWTKSYGILDAGAYRLTKSFMTPGGNTYNLAVTFEIKNS